MWRIAIVTEEHRVSLGCSTLEGFVEIRQPKAINLAIGVEHIRSRLSSSFRSVR